MTHGLCGVSQSLKWSSTPLSLLTGRPVAKRRKTFFSFRGKDRFTGGEGGGHFWLGALTPHSLRELVEALASVKPLKQVVN